MGVTSEAIRKLLDELAVSRRSRREAHERIALSLRRSIKAKSNKKTKAGKLIGRFTLMIQHRRRCVLRSYFFFNERQRTSAKRQ
jgi:hypothetical protein